SVTSCRTPSGNEPDTMRSTAGAGNRRASRASNSATTASAIAAAIHGPSSAGQMDTAMLATTSSAVVLSSRGAGMSMGDSVARCVDAVQQALENRVAAVAFDFQFGRGHHAMTQARQRHPLHVVRRDVVATGD